MFEYVVCVLLTTTTDTCASIRRPSIQHFEATRAKKAIVKLLKPRNRMWRNHRSSLSCVSFLSRNAHSAHHPNSPKLNEIKKKRIHRNYKLLLSSFTFILIIAMQRRLVDPNSILSAEHHFGHFLL